MGKDEPITAAGRTDSGSEPEKHSVKNASTHELERGFSARHLQFIAIGGAVGTGLFIGAGTALATAGPVSCLISYLFIGTILYSVMVSLGEMATFLPVPGSFTAYNSRFIDPALGFAIGWLYWFSCTFQSFFVAAERCPCFAWGDDWLTLLQGPSRTPSS